MATTQIADVSVYPPPMDAPHDSDPITFGMFLKYLGMLFAAIFMFIAAWVGKKIFGYVSNKLEEDMTEVKDTMNQIKVFISKVEHLEQTDVQILAEIAELKARITAVEQKVK